MEQDRTDVLADIPQILKGNAVVTKKQMQRRSLKAATAQEIVRLRDKAALLESAGLKASADTLRKRAAELEKSNGKHV